MRIRYSKAHDGIVPLAVVQDALERIDRNSPRLTNLDAPTYCCESILPPWPLKTWQQPGGIITGTVSPRLIFACPTI